MAQPIDATWPVLSLRERRVLGVLVEKAKTTPDVYPLSVNALVAGCNQKSNRDPVMNLSEEDVEEVLADLQKKGLAIKITGGRVVRWRHTLYDSFHVGKIELAALAELLLRDPQTEGELRSRASRMEPLDDLDALRAVLRPLAERRLVVYLGPEGRRGTVLTHGFHAPDELKHLQSMPRQEPEAAAPERRAPRHSDAPDEVGELHRLITDVQAAVEELRREIDEMRQSLPGRRENGASG